MDDQNKSREQLIAELRQLRAERAQFAHLEAIPDQVFRVGPDLSLIGYFQGKGTVPMVPPEQFLGRHLLEVFPSALGQQLRATVEAAARTGDLQAVEYVLDIDGKPESYEARCVPASQGEVLCVVREITDRKRTEEDLRTSQQLLADSQRIAQIGSWRYDFATGTIMFTDEQYRIFGYSPCEVMPTFEMFLEHVFPDDREHAKGKILHSASTGETYQYEHRIVRRDGEVRMVHCTGQVMFDEAGRPIAMIGATQDVTERKALEEALRAQNEQLMELDRLKSSFVNSVSHELRTPLTSIMGYAEFLEDEVAGSLSPDQLAFVTQIQRGALRLGNLVDDLLDFARLQSGAFKLQIREVDLPRKLAEALDALYPQAQDARVELSLDLVEEFPHLQGDPERIGQVLTNLIGNAIKFTPPGGRVVVSARVSDDAVRVEVRDTGIGISPRHQAKLFSKFYQIDPSTTREKGGAGLGLSITKALVEAHGGQIGMTSVLGEGSCFWFALPLDPPSSPPRLFCQNLKVRAPSPTYRE
jgi:PAS domain S-box-containing protein